METNYTATGGERLDSIVFSRLGTLDTFEEILQNNPHLQEKIILEEGDVVSLEAIKRVNFIVKKEEVADANRTDLSSQIEIEIKELLIPIDEEENLKALW